MTLIVFDAYGTLFDLASAVGRHRAELGTDTDRLNELWRSKQLEYAFVRTLSGAPWRDFEALTAEALTFALARFPGIPPGLHSALLAAFETLSAYPDAATTLMALRARDSRLAILSNGSHAMLARAVSAAGLSSAFDAILSVDDAGCFKTHPDTYALVTTRFACAPGEVTFVSSNRWDVAGARAFGFSPVWVNRAGMPDEYPDLPPTRVVTSLAELL